MSQERIGRYGILDRIAAGGQATVYRAWDSESGQVVALKVLHPHLTHDADYIRRFRLEARLSLNINHPNVISVFEVAQHGESHFISMEYLPESLHHLLEVEARFPVERAVNIAHQICRGLQAAYDAGVEVHRDIKPQNVLLAPDGTMKLTDFGIARAADLSGMTATGAVIGTPHYMSPEQARGERASRPSDIYSIGITLYQMLSGELPFIGYTPMAVLEKHRTAAPRTVRQLQADVPRAVESIIDRCLAKDPNRRYQTPRELAQALQEAVPAAVSPSPRPRTATPRPVAVPPTTPTPPPPPPRPAAPAPQPFPSTFMRAWESAVRARRSGPLWARFFALTALLAVVAGIIYVVLQPTTGGSDQLPLGAPVATATPTIGPVAPTPTTGRALREVTLNDGGMIFEDDFELLDLRGWSNWANDVTHREQFTRFLGRFDNETVTLNLAALPPHDQVELTFDLYLIDSWSGVVPEGPDFFKVGHSGSTNNLLLHTFSTYCEQHDKRSYTATQPESCGELIGFGRVRPDSIYRNLNNGFVFEHSESTLSISFTEQKQWGIDNVRVSIRGVATDEPVRATGPIAGLPAGAVPFRDHHYLIVNNSMGWPEANAYAESLSGYLVAIGDEEENLFVADLAEANGVVAIGLTYEVAEGHFVWANGEPLVYTNWGSSEPNNAGDPNEPYVQLSQEFGRWDDVPNFNYLNAPFVVEFEGLPGPTYGGTMRVGMLADHVTFDPPRLTGLARSDIAVVQHTYDGLVFRDADLSIQPALATSWETNADATQWTFHLREGVTFRHGKGFDASDVIFTFNRLFEVESPLASVMARPLGIVALDRYTVRFDFASPNAVLLESLVKYHAYITPSDVDPARFAIETLGTGPFIMTNHEDRGTPLERNPDYWNERLPLLDKVTFVYMSNAEELAAELMAGGIDVIYDLGVGSVDTLRDHPDTVVAQAPSGSYMNLAMDVRQPPFDNVLVRRALQAATDRETILQVALQGLGGIAYDHPILPDDPVFSRSCIPPEFNPNRARELLAEAGYPRGIDLTLYTSDAGGGPMIEMAQVFQGTAAEAGINIDIIVADPDTYWSDVWLQKPCTTVWWSGRPPP